jgi:8-oxo-dGTP diphosphatase
VRLHRLPQPGAGGHGGGRARPPLQGYWAPPAGHVEIDESVEAATRRETQEEAGVEVALDGLAGVYSQADIGVMIVAYRGRVVSGEARAGEDAEEVAYFAPGALPEQPPPDEGTPMDAWFYQVLESILAPWKGDGA